MYTELPWGGLTWVIHKNGHLSITLSYMLILISPSHHSNGVLSSNNRKALACVNCMNVLKRWPPSGGAREDISGSTHPFQIKFQNYFTVFLSEILF